MSKVFCVSFLPCPRTSAVNGFVRTGQCDERASTVTNIVQDTLILALAPIVSALSHREHANILSAIAAVNIFIEAGVQKGGVLVHCAGGRSRSAAFVAAFIMSTQGCGFDPAFAQVRRARPVASLNRGFEQQLRAYGAAQCDVFVASQMMLRIRAAALLDRRNLLLLRRNSNASAEGAVGGRGAGSGTGGSTVAEQTKLPPPMPSPQHQASSLTSTTGTRGIPPTPRSPRGRGRSPAGGSPAMRWQHKSIGGGSTGGGAATAGSAEAAAAAAGAVAAGGGLGLGKIRDDQIIFLPKEVCFFGGFVETKYVA